MAFTVTATQGGTGAQADMALSVVVLTGAIEGGGANFQAQPLPGAAQGTLTPNFTGSAIYWAICNADTNAAWTLNSNNTDSGGGLGDFGDGTAGFEGTTGKYTGTVTAGTGVTIGASAPTANNTSIAGYEIHGSPVVDASTPAFTSGLVSNLTTAAFTPPGGAVLVAVVASNASGAALETMSITDTSGLGLVWTQRAVSNSSGVSHSLSAVFTATMPGGAVPKTLPQQKRYRRQVLQRPTPGPPPSPPILPGLLKGPPAAVKGTLTSAVAPPLPPPPFQPPQPGSRAWRQRFRKPQTPQGPLPAPPVTVPLILPLARGAPAALKGTTSGITAPPPVIHPSVPSPFFPPHALLRGAMAAVKGRLASARGLVPVSLERGLLLRGSAGIKGKTFGQAAPPPVTYPSKPIPQHSLLQPAPHAAKGKTFGQAAPPPVIHPSVPSPFYAPHALLRGAMAAARGKLAWVRGRPGVPATFTPPPAPLKGAPAAFRGKLAGIVAPPPPAVPAIPAPFALPRTLLHPAPPAAARGKLTGQAGRPGVPAPFYAPHSLLKPAQAAAARGTLTRAVYGRPGVPAPFAAPHAPLRGVMAARKGTIAGVIAPPPVAHPSVPAPFFPPHSLLAGRIPARARTPLTGIIAPPPVINPPNLYLGIWQGSTHHIAPPAGNVILGANHPGPGSGPDKRGDFERSGD